VVACLLNFDDVKTQLQVDLNTVILPLLSKPLRTALEIHDKSMMYHTRLRVPIRETQKHNYNFKEQQKKGSITTERYHAT